MEVIRECFSTEGECSVYPHEKGIKTPTTENLVLKFSHPVAKQDLKNPPEFLHIMLLQVSSHKLAR
jgi:hypothetical protein